MYLGLAAEIHTRMTLIERLEPGIRDLGRWPIEAVLRVQGDSIERRPQGCIWIRAAPDGNGLRRIEDRVERGCVEPERQDRLALKPRNRNLAMAPSGSAGALAPQQDQCAGNAKVVKERLSPVLTEFDVFVGDEGAFVSALRELSLQYRRVSEIAGREGGARPSPRDRRCAVLLQA